MQPIEIGIIGDFDPSRPSHAATNASLLHACDALRAQIEIRWLSTPSLLSGDAPRFLSRCAGLWAAPGSPYRSLEGALSAIRFAREGDRPFLGTCGGFQHALVEYARGVCGLAGADHTEYSPDAAVPLIVAACRIGESAGPTLSGRMSIAIAPGSIAARVYNATRIEESFTCSYELNPRFETTVQRGGLRITGRGEAGEARIVELPRHRFFVATLFQPQLSSTPRVPHPMVVAFLRAAVAAAPAAQN